MRTAFVTSKFGGSSVATADMIRTVRNIVRFDDSRRAIVVSAPGNRFEGDVKITDLLERWAENGGKSHDPIYLEIAGRFRAIVDELGIDFNLDLRLRQITALVRSAETLWSDRLKPFAMSRGEWLNAQIVAEVLNYTFVDAADFVSFDEDGHYDHKRTLMRAHAIDLRSRARNGIVVPGYYGSGERGHIVTFPRDGSDISGSILAALVGASVYENFSDVDGFLATSPKIVDNPEKINEMTYKEARELAFMGSPILQPHAVKHAMDAKIPIHVRKTTGSLGEGTWIRPKVDTIPARPVTGIAVKKGGLIVSIEKYGMDEEERFIERASKVFADHGVSIHNCPGSVDTLSFIVLDPGVRQKLDAITRDLEIETGGEIRFSSDIAVICVVGRGMMQTVGVAARITGALAENGINIVLLNQGSSERNVEVGVHNDRAEDAVRAIYRAFFGE